MKANQRNRVKLFVVLFALSSLLWLGQLSSVQADSSPTPQQIVQSAWELVQESNRYHFETQIEQVAYPLPGIANTGKDPQESNLALQGSIDQQSKLMEMTLWRDGSMDPNSGVAVRIENNRAYGRLGQGDWEEVDNVGNLFAPGGDPLAFLAGVQNVRVGESRDVAFGSMATGLWLSQYIFDLNGPAFGDYVRQQLEAQLQEQGKLPAGMQLATAELYRTMTGTGELWLDNKGVPVRLDVAVEFLAQEGTGRVTATIANTFTDYEFAPRTSLLTQPQEWLNQHRSTIHQIATYATAGSLVITLGFLFITYYSTRQAYILIVSAVILSMLATPFLQVATVQAFVEEQNEAQTAQEARQAEVEQVEQGKEVINNDWNPNQNPLTIANAPELATNNYQIQATTTITTTDSDGDGLSDADEDIWYSCAFSGAPTNCAGVSDSTDSDGDGLSDGTEVHLLGTVPTRNDSDGDTINDLKEVQGFSYNGTTWYLNPMARDSNHDDRPDSLDCEVWSFISPDYDPSAICPDTDNDGTPDLFDSDNDGDGIDDNIDMAPNNVAGLFSDINPFTYQINNLILNKPVLVDFQIVPANKEHLTYYNRVLDWPAGDYDGQIERVLDTTFATTTNSAIQSDDANASYGDIRLIPMLEITMPGSSGHFANLPINDTYSGSIRPAGLPVADWLDTTDLDPYGITIRDLDNTSGDLAAYLPLSIVSDKEGANVQAYAARMVYYPEQGSGGVATWPTGHEVRFVWLVQMITDSCQNPDDDPLTCSRTETLEVVHVYNENWRLGGMQVSEEHGLDVAMMYENPAGDPDLTVDDQLWGIAWNLNNTFLRGRDCDGFIGGVCQSNTQRDVTVNNLATKIAEWSSNSDYVEIANFSYPHEGYSAQIALTETLAVLNAHFTPIASQTDPTFLFATERRLRGQNLANATANSNQYTFNLDPTQIKEKVIASMSWAPSATTTPNGKTATCEATSPTWKPASATPEYSPPQPNPANSIQNWKAGSIGPKSSTPPSTAA